MLDPVCTQWSVAAQQVQACADATDARYSPVTVANRIEKLAAEMRDRQRRLDGYSHTFSSTLTEETPDATAARRDRLAYWEAVRAEQIATGRATGHSRDTVKTVSVTTGYSWTSTTPYAEIQQHERPE